MNLNLNDPGLPAPGELQMSPSTRPLAGSPRRERAPSLGELHQELEYEQEGQVVRSMADFFCNARDSLESQSGYISANRNFCRTAS